jgi:AAA15 family ATPase/GTPase
MSNIAITSIRFKNYKALGNYTVSLNDVNILVGPNNCGKSTIISAFRILESALKTACSKSAYHVPSHTGNTAYGHLLPENNLTVTLENVHTDYLESNSKIEFRFSNKNKLILFFPMEGGCILNWDTNGKSIRSPSSFKKLFPFKIQVVPVLGPIEQEEKIVTDGTVNRSLGTHRACRHFRNYWYKNPDGFENFKRMIEETWPGMSIKLPEITSIMEQRLIMFCSEKRQDRELYWSGLGFQIWCQILTHLSRAHEYNLTVIDEPEIYLHPDVQRQFLGILRDLNIGVIIATHSSEIIGEADPNEILLVNKNMKSAKRLRDIEGVQQVLDAIGSIQNLTLTQLARTKKILFVEGMNDYKIIRRFAKNLNFNELAAGADLAPFESGGYSSWERVRSFAWGIQKTLGADIQIGAIYDRDYWCEEQGKDTLGELKKNLSFAHIHERKEIENYLIIPSVLERVLFKLIEDRNRKTDSHISTDQSMDEIIKSISENHKIDLQSQYVGKYVDYMKSKGSPHDGASLTAIALKKFETKWQLLDERLTIVSGKKFLKEIRGYIKEKWSVTLTDISIIDEFKENEIPSDLRGMIEQLDLFRKKVTTKENV